jgi:hypothetical protein
LRRLLASRSALQRAASPQKSGDATFLIRKAPAFSPPQRGGKTPGPICVWRYAVLRPRTCRDATDYRRLTFGRKPFAVFAETLRRFFCVFCAPGTLRPRHRPR